MLDEIIIIVLSVLVLPGIGFYFFAMAFAANRIYILTLKRQSKEQWGRSVSEMTPSQLYIDEQGMIWHNEYADKKQDVHIVNNGLNLWGEYYDLGYDKTVMILSGRTESLRYGYYFARPYTEANFNVLVVDPRAHGQSDGEYNTVGFEESRDTIAWARYLQDEHGVDFLLFHGICIGSAAGMLAITSPDCPECVKGIVTEGMFVNFGESMRNHLIERKKNFFPVLQFVDMWMKHYTHHSMMKGPINYIDKLDKPLLMLQSKEDIYSTPENAQKLYDKCNSPVKKLVYFEKGAHSQLRPTDTEKYDREIKEFIFDVFGTSKQNTASEKVGNTVC